MKRFGRIVISRVFIYMVRGYNLETRLGTDYVNWLGLANRWHDRYWLFVGGRQ